MTQGRAEKRRSVRPGRGDGGTPGRGYSPRRKNGCSFVRRRRCCVLTRPRASVEMVTLPDWRRSGFGPVAGKIARPPADVQDLDLFLAGLQVDGAPYDVLMHHDLG